MPAHVKQETPEYKSAGAFCQNCGWRALVSSIDPRESLAMWTDPKEWHSSDKGVCYGPVEIIDLSLEQIMSPKLHTITLSNGKTHTI